MNQGIDELLRIVLENARSKSEIRLFHTRTLLASMETLTGGFWAPVTRKHLSEGPVTCHVQILWSSQGSQWMKSPISNPNRL